ncbi:MAG: TolC family protein [Bacteroidota bacterium]
MRFIIICLGLLGIGQASWAQDGTPTILTLEEAINTALQQNPAIKIQRIATQVAENQVFKANAGKTPIVNALGSASYTNNFSQIDIRTFQPEPPEIRFEEAGVESFTANVGVQADYVLFDGGASNYRYQLLSGQSLIARAEQEVLINNTILAVSQLYLEILKLQNQEQLLLENIAISKERLQKMQDRAKFGKANQLAVLTAETNLRQDEAALDNILLIRNNLTKDLNFLLGRPAEDSYQVERSYSEPALPSIQELKSDLLDNSPEIQLGKRGIELSASQLALSEAQQKPTVSSFAQAGYFYQQNDVQQLASIQNLGLTIGLSARYNLFDGGLTRRRIETAQLDNQLQNLRLTQIEEQLINEALKEHQTMTLLKAQLERERMNLQTFEAAFQKAQDRYYTGKANSLDLRDAQLARLQVRIRIDQLEIDLMQSGIRMDKLRGRLLQQGQ